MTNDNIVEGNETFNINLNVPPSLAPGIVAGSVTRATGIIIDSSGKTNVYYVVIIQLSYYVYITTCSYQSEVCTEKIHCF